MKTYEQLAEENQEMLEALKANLTALEEIREMFTTHDMPGLPDLIEQTVAAIAKAEGKEVTR